MAETSGFGEAGSAHLAFLLRQGRAWDQDGQLYRAMSAYFDILTRDVEGPEAVESKTRLMELARAFEQDGQLYRALGLYDRLAKVEEGTYSTV